MTSRSLRLTWPWQDSQGRFSSIKASTFALMFYPLASMSYNLSTGGFGPLPLVGLIYWSGVWATAVLLLTLAVRPASVIFHWKRLIAVRRIIGVSALTYTIAHVIVYFALYRWNFAFLAKDVVSRLTLVVATVSTIGLIALGSTSLDAAVRWMGSRRWKRLHRTNYLLTTLAVGHYLLSPGIFSTQYLMAGMLFWLMVWRWLARHGRAADPGVLASLAVVSCLFTVFLEAGWMWAYHDVDPWQPLGDNFSLILGISSAWRILGFGLLIAFAAVVFRTGAKPVSPAPTARR